MILYLSVAVGTVLLAGMVDNHPNIQSYTEAGFNLSVSMIY